MSTKHDRFDMKKARLIEAAPEMLEALKLYQSAIASCLSVGGVVLTEDGTPNDWWEAVIAAQQAGARAISKAKAEA